jgi:hypothetical protein
MPPKSSKNAAPTSSAPLEEKKMRPIYEAIDAK